MKYRPTDFHTWDAWCVPGKDGLLHLYHMQIPEEGKNIPMPEGWCWGHATSPDMIHWTEQPGILHPHGLKNDAEVKFTGCTVEKDGKYYMFYVMREAAYQRIGLALSDDMYEWREYEGNPVIVPDPDLFVSYADCPENRCAHPLWGNNVDCRDMLVVKYGEGYYGFFVAASDLGGRAPVGVIAYAYSEDLIHWDQRGIAYRPDGTNVVEMIDVFEMNGRWNMLILTSNAYGCRSCFSDKWICRGEIFASAATPDGPFVEDINNNTFIGGSDNSGFSCRTCDFRGEKRLLYIDTANNRPVLTLPKNIRIDTDGCPRPYFAADLLAGIRTEAISPEIAEHPPCSFAWPTRGGEWSYNGGALHGVADRRSWQGGIFGGSSKNLEIAFSASCGCREFGILFSQEGNFFGGTKYAIVINPTDNIVYLSNPYKWEKFNIRGYDFHGSADRHYRALLVDETIELYIDGELVLQNGIINPGSMTPGVFVDEGQVTLTDIELWKLED